MILTPAQIDEIQNIVNNVLAKVYAEPISLIEKKANERSIAFRFGLYLTEYISQSSFGADNDLIVDFDYNRNGEGIKGMDGFSLTHGVYPDIIFHHRGFNDKNIFVVEMKGYWNKLGREDDLKKLIGFTHPQMNDYHYGLGLFLELKAQLDHCELNYYLNGANYPPNIG